MPRGQGYGMGQGRKRGQRKMFFLQSCLLVLLHREAGYGYSLMVGLQEFGFQSDQMDISIIYRALREMQAEGLISDSWDNNSLGPQRRMYTITADGEEALSTWIDNLRQRRKEIEALEAAYDVANSRSEE